MLKLVFKKANTRDSRLENGMGGGVVTGFLIFHIERQYGERTVGLLQPFYRRSNV